VLKALTTFAARMRTWLCSATVSGVPCADRNRVPARVVEVVKAPDRRDRRQ
jgi:hypothetical protein